MLTLRRNVFSLVSWANKRMFPVSPVDEDKIEASQRVALEEKCLLVTERDVVTGSATKRDCHLWQNGNVPLHRAFSVFIFNSNNEMLVQQRATTKITFPGYYANACCSHPLDIYEEMEEKDTIGVRRAAARRCEYELGVRLEPSDFTFLTRILYKAPFDDTWGEHEVDYVLVARKDVTLRLNPNEVIDYRWVPRDGFQAFLDKCADRRVPLTPWFRIIASRFLLPWWDNLDNLEAVRDTENIHKICDVVAGTDRLPDESEVRVEVIKALA